MPNDLRALAAEAEGLQTQLTEWRRDFHRHPEIAHQEYRTAAVIEAELAKLGIETQRVADTGVLGVLHGLGKGGHTVALRADIDALPVQELDRERPYCSENAGVMHACGHDGHTACLLGGAALLAAHKNDFGGEVRFLFQPAEEVGGGAVPLIEAGALGSAERIFGLHTAPDIPTGTVGLKPGLNNASVDHFTITVQGRSAHVSTPHLGIDALYIASHIVIAAQALVTRMTSPVEPLILGIGKLQAGTAYNALAETAVLEGTTRAVSVPARARIRRLLDETAQSVAALYGGTVSAEWEDFTAPLLNDPQVTREAASVVDALYGPGHVKSDRALSLGGDDFAEYLLKVPGAYAYLGTGDPDKPGTQGPAHNGAFDLDEDALPMGAALYAGCALGWLRGVFD